MVETRKSKRKGIPISIRWQGVIWFTITFSIVSLIAYQLFLSLVIHEADHILQTDLTQAMEAAAAGVDVNMLLDLAKEGQPNEDGFTDDPRYFELLSWLDMIHQSDPDMWPYLYIESEQEGYVYLVVDLYYLYNQNKSAFFMEHYKSNSGFILEGLEHQTFRAVESELVIWLRQQAEGVSNPTIQTVLENTANSLSASRLAPGRDFGTYTDKFGRWASGYMPLQTPQGEPQSAIGVDYEADLIENMHTTVKMRMRQFYVVSYILGVTLILWLGFMITHPLIRLTDTARYVSENVADASFGGEKSGGIRDEIDDLEQILAEMVEKIKIRDQRYKAVVSSQTELIVRWKPDGNFSFFNPAFVTYFPAVDPQISSEANFSRVLPLDQPKVRDLLQRVLPTLTKNNPLVTIEVSYTIKEGVQKDIQWNVLALFGQDEQIEEYQAVGHDITEIKELMEKLDFANQQLHSFSHDLMVEREKDRADLARDLHDEILNYMSALFMHEEELPPAVQENYQLVANKIRETIYLLRPPMLSYGLYLGIEDLVDSLKDRFGAETEIIYTLSSSEARFDPDVEIQIFRIVQEACRNALVHAGPTKLFIRGQITPTQVWVEIEDNGEGFELKAERDTAILVADKKFGLVGMNERASIIGARLMVKSSVGEGTTIRLEWEPEAEGQE